MTVRWLAIAVVALMLAGCQSAELRERHARRAANRAETIAECRESEALHPARLAATMDLIGERFEQDGQQCRANKTALKRWWSEQFERWEVARPCHAQGFKEIMAGDPESMRRTSIMFLD